MAKRLQAKPRDGINAEADTNQGLDTATSTCRLTNDDAVADKLRPAKVARLPRLTGEQRDLVAKHLGLVGVHLRTRVPTPHQPMRYREYDDLFQHGCVALARAAAKYRPHRDGPFAAYALPRIRGAVYNALHDLFTVVHVPARAIYQAREQPVGALRRPPLHVQDITEDIAQNMIVMQTVDIEADTIRHAVHKRFEVAVRRSLDEMRTRVWRYRNPCEIMTRIVHERLLIDDERFRTPLRQIAREAGVSSGRACDYEKLIVNAVTDRLKEDPQMRVLIEMVQEDGAGWDATMDASRRRRLMQAELGEFEARFTAMEPSAQARLIYSLIERSSQCIPEVARNLFRLTMSMEDNPVPAVA